MSLNNSNILITGATGGLGSFLSLEFAKRGANLILVDKDKKGLIKIYDQIESENNLKPLAIPLDFLTAGDEEFETMAEELKKEFGKIDHLIHAASLFKKLAPFTDLSSKDLENQFRVNCLAAFGITRACIELLRKSEKGRILLISEEHAFRKGKAYWTSFAISNIGLKALMGF